MVDSKQNYENRMAVIVSRYATPLALLLIGMGILLAQPPGPARKAAGALWAFGLVFNLVMVHLIKNEGAGRELVMARLFINVFVNTIIFYLLAAHWPPIWLLLALTPIATAIYSSRKDTVVISGIVAGVILMVHFMHGSHSAATWGRELSYCLFVLLISLLINELSQLARAGLDGPPGARLETP